MGGKRNVVKKEADDTDSCNQMHGGQGLLTFSLARFSRLGLSNSACTLRNTGINDGLVGATHSAG